MILLFHIFARLVAASQSQLFSLFRFALRFKFQTIFFLSLFFLFAIMLLMFESAEDANAIQFISIVKLFIRIHLFMDSEIVVIKSNFCLFFVAPTGDRLRANFYSFFCLLLWLTYHFSHKIGFNRLSHTKDNRTDEMAKKWKSFLVINNVIPIRMRWL